MQIFTCPFIERPAVESHPQRVIGTTSIVPDHQGVASYVIHSHKVVSAPAHMCETLTLMHTGLSMKHNEYEIHRN